MSKRLEIAEFLLIAEAVLGVEAERLSGAVRLSAVEAALAAPFATIDGAPFYADPVERAAICCSRIIRHNPLPDGNKRVAYECMRELLDRSGVLWPRPREDAEEIARKVQGLAAGRLSEQEFVRWVKLRARLSEVP
ncbi:MAG TPA: Fic family protein [Solirubrobacterales bacterium]|nr:Fic family protein [Solirubrobacterales bacterium]